MSKKPEKPEPADQNAPPKGNPMDEHPGPNYEELGIDPNFGHSDRTRTYMGVGMIVALVFFVAFAIWSG